LREIGFIPALLQHKSANVTEFAPPPMIVDPEHNLGFAIGAPRVKAFGPMDLMARTSIGMFDLTSMRMIGRLELQGASGQLGSDDIFRFTIDPVRERILEPMNPEDPDPTCSGLPLVSTGAPRIDTIAYSSVGGKRTLRRGAPLPLPCPGAYRVVPKYNSVYEDDPSDPTKRKLYVFGTYVREHTRGLAGAFGLEDNDGQPLVIQQIDLAKLDAGAGSEALDWQFDLRYAGCGRIAVPFVQRAGHSVLSYCSDARPALAQSGNLSEQGYVVRIPLDEHDQPSVVGDARIPDPEDPAAPAAVNYLVRRTPALAGTVVPFVDPGTGTVLLLSNDAANGNATWVFDPIAERFVGVVTGGNANQPVDKTAAGFDPLRGRTYLFTSSGMLMAQIRQRPLPTGTIYDVVARDSDRAWVPQIAVAPKLHRLFVPLARNAQGKGRGGWVVLEDDVPDPPPARPDRPDENTTQIAENPATTQVETRGAAVASGAHLLAVGGVTRGLNQSDPLCDPPLPDAVAYSERNNFDGRCIWEILIASGNRELFFADTSVEAGTATGAVADASGLTFSETDHTDQDFKRAGECYRSSAKDVIRGLVKSLGGSDDDAAALAGVYERYEAACTSLQESFQELGGPDLSAGTRGPDDEGFPVERSECAAFDEADDDGRPPDTILAQFSSSVMCDPRAVKATADAAAAGLTLPDLADPIVSVARMTSSVRSVRTERGQETIVEAIAEGVRIGPLRIGEVRTIATTRAKGRSKTASATIDRRWCRVTIDGEPPTEDCIDPTSPENRATIDQVNQALGRARISVPDAAVDASAGGYQAVVTKSPDVRAADEAVNDDDSHTVSALQLVIYNDGPEGRNRIVLQLAGVHAESRYGIQPIPDIDNSRGADVPSLDVPVDNSSQVLPTDTSPGSAFKRFFRKPGRVLRHAIGWLVNNPREFLLLFLLLTILATPVYLTIRRRVFEQVVTS
jgi:hypothetical protein